MCVEALFSQIWSHILCDNSLLTVHSKPTKKKIQGRVIPQVATYWYELGIELLSEDQEKYLDIIKSDYGNNHKKCCAEMFWHWLRSDPNASWYQLVESLKSPAMELHSLASEIESMFPGLFVNFK